MTGNTLRQFSPVGINKADKLYEALIADETGKGAIANETDALNSFIDSYINGDNVDNQTDAMLDKTINFFSGLKRYFDESDHSFLNRFKAITARAGDTVWGNKWNIIHTFTEYFTDAKIYIAENTSHENENLLTNGDFEESGGWEYEDCETVVQARFSKSNGLFLNNKSSARQRVRNLFGTHFFHFFLKGSVNISIQKSNGDYWDGGNSIWSVQKTTAYCNSSEWNNQSIFFILSEMDDITISFEQTGSNNSFIDYCRLYKKYSYPSFSVIVSFSGEVTGPSLELAEGRDDPVDKLDYSKLGYYNDIFLTGLSAGLAQDVYADILEIVKPVGVKAYIELVQRNYIEGEE